MLSLIELSRTAKNSRKNYAEVNLRQFHLSLSLQQKKSMRSVEGQTLPLVFLHGMGDSCFNSGMDSITKESGDYLGVYSVCIPTGETRLEDTINGFLLNMNANVDVFAEKVRADPQLASGFNCVGLSQGNNICRGYIQRYNDPPVSTHLSIHGPVAGVASLPHCYPDSEKAGDLCQQVDELLGTLAYNSFMQNLLFQADYFREVSSVDSVPYKKTSQMGDWNNEAGKINQEYKTNFGKTNKFAMIKANADTVVVPREGEWWGQYTTDYKTLTMKETEWYKQDLFGLRTADEAGKLFFNSTEGNHLDFSDEELYGWLDSYCA